LRLIAYVVERVRATYALRKLGRAWFEICGAAPYPLLDEDTQVWVSCARRADTDEVLEEKMARSTVEPKEQLQNGARLA